MKLSRTLSVATFMAAATTCVTGSPATAATVNLVQNGSFEGTTGTAPAGWLVGGLAADGYEPVTIAYNQTGSYPFGAQGESVPTDNATSPGPDKAGSNGVYFVSDEAKQLSLYQTVYLNPGSYQIGFDSYDTYNGSVQHHDATLTADIAGVQLADFKLSSVDPGSWTSHVGEARITTAGNYLVSFVFDTPDYPDNPFPVGSKDQYNAKDVVIDRAFVIETLGGGGTTIPSPVPLPASAPMFAAAVLALGTAGLAAKRKETVIT